MPKKNHEYGDAPVEAKYIEAMQELARYLDRQFNGDKPWKERETGFILMVFPFNDRPGRCNYISNGIDRKDVVALMKEQIAYFEKEDD